MSGLFSFLATHRDGIFVFLLVLVVVVLLVQWVSWIFAWGRFRGVQRGSILRGFVAEFVDKVITEFRHLLALVIVLIFAVALGYALVQSQAGTSQGMNELQEALTIVVSTLGSLVGLILGYYFGEQARTPGEKARGRNDGEEGRTMGTGGPPMEKQKPPSGNEGAEITRPSRKPPKKDNAGSGSSTPPET